jgi:hypothetical protein
VSPKSRGVIVTKHEQAHLTQLQDHHHTRRCKSFQAIVFRKRTTQCLHLCLLSYHYFIATYSPRVSLVPVTNQPCVQGVEGNTTITCIVHADSTDPPTACKSTSSCCRHRLGSVWAAINRFGALLSIAPHDADRALEHTGTQIACPFTI